jgi:PKD repeat protein
LPTGSIDRDKVENAMQTHALIAAVLMIVLFVFSCTSATSALEPAPAIEWQQMLGGSGTDEGYSAQQTSDGGYIITGISGSSDTGDVSETTAGGFDVWVARLDAAGSPVWDRLLGGSEDEEAHSVQQTADGGYILAGYTESSATGDITGTNHGAIDIWVVKLTAGGAVQWQRLYGGGGNDFGECIRQTVDGGYILLGWTGSSKSGNVTGTNHGDADIWVAKLDGTGAIEWQRSLGGAGRDVGYSVRQTADGGYICVGYSASSASGDVTGGNKGLRDLWAVKLSSTATTQWQQLLGGTDDDEAHDVEQTVDGGYIVAGHSYSSASGDVTEANHGVYGDFWAVRLTSTGAVQWQHLYGGSAHDVGRSVGRTSDGGFVITGESISSASGDIGGIGRGYIDYWTVRLDAGGAVLWERLLGGDDEDRGYSVRQTADGGYVILGFSESTPGGDVTDAVHGPPDYLGYYPADFWMVKLEADAPGVAQIPGGTSTPKDGNADGLYEDVNGNGRKDFADVVLYFNQMTWIAANEPVSAFDCNGNGRIDFADVVWLFNNL